MGREITVGDGVTVKMTPVQKASTGAKPSGRPTHANDPRDANAADEWYIVRQFGILTKELRQAKRDYFADNPMVLYTITPFDLVATKMEALLENATP